jgi:hypothetical protein
MEPSAFKALNFFKKGQTLPDGTPLKYWNLDIIWSQLKTTADYDNRYPFRIFFLFHVPPLQGIPSSSGIFGIT